MSWMQQLGEEIAKARRKAGLTQAELGHQVAAARRDAGLSPPGKNGNGVSRQMIGLYEKGEVAPPFETLACIASVLKADKFIVQDLHVTFNRNGSSQESNVIYHQLELAFEKHESLTLRIESESTGFKIRALSA